MATYSDVEEDLLAQQEEEEERARALEEQNQIDRMTQGQEEPTAGQQVANAAREYAKDAAKQAAKKAVKQVAKRTFQEAVVETAPVWGPIAGVIGAILLIILLGWGVILTVTSYCNASGATGVLARLASTASNFIPGQNGQYDVCGALAISNQTPIALGGQSGGGGATGSFEPLDLVSLVGLVSVDTGSTSDPRVRQCMATKVEQIFAAASAQGISITITSAFRGGATTANGGTSAHSRGEAVDIALRDPTVPIHGSDPRITKLVAIAKAAGFTPPQGDTLDEYTNPTENASGGHVHVEFNIPNGDPTQSYCAPFPTA